MSQDSEKFRYFSAFNDQVNLQSIIFSNNSPLLELELNELQDIQNQNRQNLARTLIPSGFTELVDKRFSSVPIVYQPVDNLNNYILNSIAIAPCKAILNGINVNLIGNYSTQQAGNYLLLNLGEAPETGTREDLIYLEMWLERASYKDTFQLEGYMHGDNIDYNILDSRVQDETSRRIIVRYSIRVAQDINFNKFPDGFGYNSVNDFSNIQAVANGEFSTYHKELIYKPANYLAFKNQPFYKDNNLYIAGLPNHDLNSNRIIGNFIYALPMFRIKRRNKQDYSLQNYNGSRTVIYQYNDIPSSVYGDLLNNIRPDHYYYDVITEDDTIDLRKVVLNNNLYEYYLNQGLKELFTGKLQTKDKSQVRRVQFGRQYIDYSENDNVVLHVEFDDNIEPDELEDYPAVASMTSDEVLYEPIYKDAIIARGLYIDGRAEYKYTTGACNINRGTLDFYTQFLYDGHTDINQTIFTIIDVNGNIILKCVKEKDQLILKVNRNVDLSEETDNESGSLVVDLKNTLIFAKQINIFRIAWNSDPSKSYIIFYINGSFVARISYAGSVLIPHALIIGSKDDAQKYAGLNITDEEKAKDQDFYTLNSQEIDISDISVEQVRQTLDKLLLNKNIIYANVEGNQYEFNFADIAFDIENNNIENNNIENNTSDENNTEMHTNDETSDENNNNDDKNTNDNDDDVQLNVDNLTDEDVSLLLEDEKIRILLMNRLKNAQKNEKKLYQQKINKKRSNHNYGFIIEELVLYNTTYEQNITSDNTAYFVNEYWPGLPKDFINGSAKILPSFNSLYRGFGDITLKQNEIIQVLNGENGLFSLPVSIEKKVHDEPIAYKSTGEVDIYGNILTVPGTWYAFDEEWIFQADDITLTSIVVQYTVEVPAGNGGSDLPEEILAAGYVTDTDII